MNPRHILRSIPLLAVILLLSISQAASLRCGGKKTFKMKVKVDMTYTWRPLVVVGAEDKPAGFTPVLCVAHGPGYSLWKTGSPPSPGIKPFILHADSRVLISELLNKHDTINGVGSWAMSHPWSVKSPGSDSVTVTIERSSRSDTTLVSCIAGIVPGPDWFVGISAYDMCNAFEGGKTVAEFYLRNFDADFDLSEIFLGPREDNSSPQKIHMRFGLGTSLGTARLNV